MDIRLATYQLGSLVVSTLINPFSVLVLTCFFKLGLTLGRVVMVEVTKKVNTSYGILPESNELNHRWGPLTPFTVIA